MLDCDKNSILLLIKCINILALWLGICDRATFARLKSIRDQFGRYVKKVEKSTKSGAGADDVYVPDLMIKAGFSPESTDNDCVWLIGNRGVSPRWDGKLITGWYIPPTHCSTLLFLNLTNLGKLTPATVGFA